MGKLYQIGEEIKLSTEQAKYLPVELVEESEPKVKKPTADKE